MWEWVRVSERVSSVCGPPLQGKAPLSRPARGQQKNSFGLSLWCADAQRLPKTNSLSQKVTWSRTQKKYFQPLCNILCNISGNTYTLFCITCVPPIYVFSYGCAHMHYVAYSMQCHVFPRNKNKKNKKLFLQGLSSGYAGENAVHLFFRTTHI